MWKHGGQGAQGLAQDSTHWPCRLHWLKMCLLISLYVNNTNNNNNDNNGNFICVFECTIVNLATYRQFTNAA